MRSFLLAPDGKFVAGDVGTSGSFVAEPTGSLTQLYQVLVGAALGNYGLQVFMRDQRAAAIDFVVFENILNVFRVVAAPELAFTEELRGFGS